METSSSREFEGGKEADDGPRLRRPKGEKRFVFKVEQEVLDAKRNGCCDVKTRATGGRAMNLD